MKDTRYFTAASALALPPHVQRFEHSLAVPLEVVSATPRAPGSSGRPPFRTKCTPLHEFRLRAIRPPSSSQGGCPIIFCVVHEAKKVFAVAVLRLRVVRMKHESEGKDEGKVQAVENIKELRSKLPQPKHCQTSATLSSMNPLPGSTRPIENQSLHWNILGPSLKHDPLARSLLLLSHLFYF